MLINSLAIVRLASQIISVLSVSLCVIFIELTAISIKIFNAYFGWFDGGRWSRNRLLYL